MAAILFTSAACPTTTLARSCPRWRRAPLLSRADNASASGLTKATVSTLVDEPLAGGLLTELGNGDQRLMLSRRSPTAPAWSSA